MTVLKPCHVAFLISVIFVLLPTSFLVIYTSDIPIHIQNNTCIKFCMAALNKNKNGEKCVIYLEVDFN